jgi:hypothetical protein
MQKMHVDVKNIQNIFKTKIYQQAPEATKTEWWMQLAKTIVLDYLETTQKVDVKMEFYDQEFRTLKATTETIVQQLIPNMKLTGSNLKVEEQQINSSRNNINI